MPRFSRLMALGASAALGFAACSNSPTAPQDETQLSPLVNYDMVTVAADGVGEDVDLMRDPMLHFGGPGFVSATPDFNTDKCTFSATTLAYTCSWSREALSITRVFSFFTAAGAPMAKYDAEQTAKVNIGTTVKGDVTRDRWSAQVERNRNMTVSGLQGTEQKRTWNGTGNFKANRSVHREDGTSRTYDVAGTLKVTDVVVPHSNNGAKDGWPLSGTVQREMTVKTTDRNGQAIEFTRVVTIVFNGTQLAEATVVGPKGTETFTIDLELRKGLRKP